MENCSKMSKKSWMLMFDTVVAFPEFEKIIQSYNEQIEKILDLYEKNPEKYYEGVKIADENFGKTLSEFVKKRLEKFEISLEDIIQFFDNAVSMSFNQMKEIYPKRIIINKPEKIEENLYIDDLIDNLELKNKKLTKTYAIELCRDVAMKAYVHGVEEGNLNELKTTEQETEEMIYPNPGRVMSFQMAYLSEMIIKLNPDKMEFTVPEDTSYQGSIGYNLNFDGELIINGSVERFGMFVKKGNFTINGNVRRLDLNSNKLNLTVNSDIQELNLGSVKELIVNGNVLQADILPYFDKVIINGDASIQNIYLPLTIKSKTKIKKKLGNHAYSLFEQSKRESFTVNGDLIIYMPPEEVFSNSEFYDLVDYLKIGGKLSVIKKI